MHEIYHVFQIAALGGRNVDPIRGPFWLMEGSAQWLAYRIMTLQRGVSWAQLLASEKERAAADGSPLKSLETPENWVVSYTPYSVALLATEQLVGGRGAASIADFYRRLGQGIEWHVAFAAVFDVDAETFYRSFDKSRGADSDRPTPTRQSATPNTISGSLIGEPYDQNSTLALDACLFEDPQKCYPVVASSNSFTVRVPPGRYVIMVRKYGAVMGYLQDDHLTKSRSSATILDATSASVTGVVVPLP